MKRRVLAIFCACLMTLSFTACGNNTSAVSDNDSSAQVAVVEKPSPEVTTTVEPVEEEKPSATVTEKPEEDKPDETKPTQEPAQDEVSTDTDEAKPDTTNQDTTTSTDSGTSTDTTSQDTTPATTDQQPAQDTTPAQTEPGGGGASTSNVSGTFDIDNYVLNISNASDYYMIDEQVMIVYGSWFIEMSTDYYNANTAYISMGSWDYNAASWNINTYSCVFSFGDGSSISSEKYPGYTRHVSKTALAILPTLVDYMKASGDPSVAPSIPGYTFKPCQSDNPFTQY